MEKDHSHEAIILIMPAGKSLISPYGTFCFVGRQHDAIIARERTSRNSLSRNDLTVQAQPRRRACRVASARCGLIPCRRWRTQSLRLSSDSAVWRHESPLLPALQKNDWRIVEKVVPIVHRAVPFRGQLRLKPFDGPQAGGLQRSFVHSGAEVIVYPNRSSRWINQHRLLGQRPSL